ncbi:HAD-IA family hydrolase [Peptococcus simiae]|uniref:HAD-IA family hydrolase n=1 Tax=Peptococcus simiae TaxID=1643805 RepID=A0ABW9H0Z0_9FIRM
MAFDYFLFDLDGTLIDSNKHVIDCFKYAFQEVLAESISTPEITATFGIPLETAIRAMRPAAADDLLKTYRAESDRRGQDDILMVPEADKTLAALKARGAGIAVVTSKKRVNAYKSLDQLGLSPYLDVFVGPEDTDRHKPDPKPVQIALERFAARPDQALMVGDSAHDITAAQKAGVATCGVAFATCGKETLALAQPDYMIDQLSDLLTLCQ